MRDLREKALRRQRVELDSVKADTKPRKRRKLAVLLDRMGKPCWIYIERAGFELPGSAVWTV